jgi:hypothetical protein
MGRRPDHRPDHRGVGRAGDVTGFEILAFLAAILLLLLAHLIRTVRWALLYPPDRVSRFNLLVALTLGNVVNAILPLRMGELIRVLYVRRYERIRFSFVLATIVTERISDLLVVGLFILGFSGMAGRGVGAGIAMVAVAVLLVAVARAALVSDRARGLIWRGSWPLNAKLRVATADLVWTTGEMLGPGRALHPNYLLGTATMWAAYLGAFGLFARAIGIPLAQVNATMLGDPLSPLTLRILDGPLTADEAWLMVFALSPLALILGHAWLRSRVHVGGLVDSLKGFAGFVSDRPLAAASDSRFAETREYEHFIAALFGGGDAKTSTFGLQAVDDARVVRFFHGGSDAVTALVDIGGTLRIRKFAQGASGDKLADQAEWLRRERGRGMPLVEVSEIRRRDGACIYDMPAVAPAADFFEVIHASPPEEARRLFGRLLEDAEAFHASGAEGDAAEADIAAYLSEKVTDNVDRILSFVRSEFPGDGLEINGRMHSFAAWERFRDPDWLRAQIRDTRVARIHGDLTIENVIISPVAPEGYYVIDPNPDNKFNSPLIDWAKLMQSLHLGYEALNKSIRISVEGGEGGTVALRLPLQRSQAYSLLHAEYERFLTERLGAERLREVRFHELVNYFRLTPYKIRQDPRRGLGFFACTAVLVDRYLAEDAR